MFRFCLDVLRCSQYFPLNCADGIIHMNSLLNEHDPKTVSNNTYKFRIAKKWRHYNAIYLGNSD